MKDNLCNGGVLRNRKAGMTCTELSKVSMCHL